MLLLPFESSWFCRDDTWQAPLFLVIYCSLGEMVFFPTKMAVGFVFLRRVGGLGWLWTAMCVRFYGFLSVNQVRYSALVATVMFY